MAALGPKLFLGEEMSNHWINRIPKFTLHTQLQECNKFRKQVEITGWRAK